jgi:DNA-binding transcriptional MerR regulator
MSSGSWKVGELARATELTIRTLHYDEIGLLSPRLHTDSGHRFDTASDVVRLQQIISLRRLGLSLDEVRDCLSRPESTALATIEMHLVRLCEQIAAKQRLCRRLETIADGPRAAAEVSADKCQVCTP